MDEKTHRYLPAWDPVVRFLHWWNAVAMAALIVIGIAFKACAGDGHEGPSETLVFLHAAAGFLFGAGVTARVVWLFIGSETARLGDMLPFSPRNRKVFADTVRFYLRGFRKDPPLYLAHNSFAGAAYIGFFVLAAVQVATGSSMLALAGELRRKSLASEVHGVVFILLLLFIAVHLAAVFIHEITEKRGIVSAMIHGEKTFTDEEREAVIEAYPFVRKGDFDER